MEVKNELTKSPLSNALIITDWKDDLKLVKDLTAKTCSDSEFKLLLHMANEYGLNPLKREIWAVKYGYAPAQIFVSRDGFLSIAHKSGQFNGMNTVFNEVESDDGKKDLTATCTVYRKDMDNPIKVTVYFSEYNSNQSIWKSKPRTMLQKVSESQALRRAFNIDGVYSPEEFSQAETEYSNNIEKDINALKNLKECGKNE
ncbi:MAG: phage recombination protein Bet [Candidatus Nanoarchaeia archaeon]|nr:phage recombination protein Bet [Candidatus Nanoarchaeia archaeon]